MVLNLFGEEVGKKKKNKGGENGGLERKRKPYSNRTKEWKVYELGGGVFLYQAYNSGTTPRALPNELGGIVVSENPVAYTSYEGSKSGSITSYLLKVNYDDLFRLAKRSGFSVDYRDVRDESLGEEVDRDFNVASEFVSFGSSDVDNVFIQSIRDDVLKFVKKPAKVVGVGTGFERVESLSLPLQFNLRSPNSKQLIKEGKGRFEDKCVIDIGIDSGMGCLATLNSKGFYDVSGKCSYCYAYQNSISFLDTYFDFSRQEFVGLLNEKIVELGLLNRKNVYLRLGQTVEMHVPNSLRVIRGFKDNLITILEGIAEVAGESGKKISCAMPSKTLEYDPKFAKLLRDARVSTFSSFLNSELERGIVGMGFDVKKRLDEILKFGYDGVNANVFVATDITRPMSDMQDDAKRVLDFYEKHKDVLGLQFLDVRITKKKDAKVLGGASWECLESGQTSLYDCGSSSGEVGGGKWRRNGQNYMCAYETHSDFLDVIGSNRGGIRMCSTHVKKDERKCGMCFMDRC